MKFLDWVQVKSKNTIHMIEIEISNNGVIQFHHLLQSSNISNDSMWWNFMLKRI